jgi:hypothetical protein
VMWMNASKRTLSGSSHARLSVYVAAGLPAAAVSVFWLSSMPPLWLYTDSTTILLWPTGQVPLYPPLYPIIVQAFESHFGFNPKMLHALLFAQHAFLASSIIYLGAAFGRPLLAFIISTAAVAGSWMGSFAHTVSTQGFDLPFLALLSGVAIRYCLGGWRLGLLPMFFMSVLGLALTRHASPIFAFIVPLYFIFLALIAVCFPSPSQQAGWGYLSNTIICCLCIAVALAIGSLVTRATCLARGDDCPHSTIGFQGCTRIFEVFNRIPPEERQAWLAMKTTGLSPAETFAFEAMTKGGCWTDPYWEIRKTFPNENPVRLMRDAFYHFLLSPDHFVVAQMLYQLSQGLYVNRVIRLGSLNDLLTLSTSPVPSPHNITRQRLGEISENRRQLTALKEQPFVQYYAWYTYNYLNAVALLSLIAVMILAWEPKTVALGLSFIVASFTYLVMVSAVITMAGQYIAPVNFLMYVLTAFCFCMLITRLRGRWLADRLRAICSFR